MDFGDNNDIQSIQEETIKNEEVVNKTTNNEDIENITDTDVENTKNIKSDDKVDEDEIKNHNSNTTENVVYKEGTVIEVEDKKYTINENGDLIDENNNIFKKASEINDWIKEFDNSKEIDEDYKNKENILNKVQENLGLSLVDENDNPLEFSNDENGITSFINTILDNKKEEYQIEAINSLYKQYPIVKDFLNYYVANGNSIEGFNEIPDRSNIEIDENNETQQESIIRMAWKEQGRTNDIDTYIQYLKANKLLATTAEIELENLKEKDKVYKENLEKEAQRIEEENYEKLKSYWSGVKSIIDSKTIAGYKIPDRIVINRDGKKMTVTPDDFFNYIYKVDANGQSMYEKDLNNKSQEDRTNDEILRAYLSFTGGNYSNLIDMAVNKKQIDKIKLTVKRNTSGAKRNITITTPKNKEIDFGDN